MFRSIKTLLVAITSLLLLGSVGLLAASLYFSSLKEIERLLGSRAQGIASTAAAMIDGDMHDEVVYNLAEAGEMSELKTIRKQLSDVKTLNNLETDVYTLIKADWVAETMVFVAVGNDSAFEVKGQPLEPHVDKTIEGGPAGHTELFETENGVWITGYAPITTSEGDITGVVEVALSTAAEVAAAKETFLKNIAAVALVVLLLGMFISFFMARSIAKPIEKLAVTVRGMAGGDLKARVENVKGRDEVALLAKDFNTMATELETSHKQLKDYSENLESLVAERTAEVVSEKHKIQLVLDNIEQGIILAAPGLKAEEQFSLYFAEILEIDSDKVAGMDIVKEFFSRLSFSADSLNHLCESLNAAIGEDELSWDVNCENLPSETTFEVKGKTKILSLDWTPVLSKEDVVEKVIISVRDLTKQKQLEHEMALASAESAFLSHAVTTLIGIGRSKFSEFADDFRSRVDAVFQELEKDSPSGTEIFRNLHTIKGVARTYDLKHLVDETHLAENFAKQIKDNETCDIADFKLHLDAMNGKLQRYLLISTDILSWGEPSGADSCGGSKRLSFSCALDIITKAFDSYLSTNGVYLERLNISDEVKIWKESAFKRVMVILQHAFTNTVDHGFVNPIKAGEPHHNLCLSVAAKVIDNKVEISIEDNGKGISFATIRKKMSSKGLPEMTDEQILSEGMFIDGVSTATELTELSGRGAGSSIIRAETEALEGQVRYMIPESGKGMRLVATIPLANCFDSNAAESNPQNDQKVLNAS